MMKSFKGTHLDYCRAVEINKLATEVHGLNQKWWVHPATGEPIERNVGELLMLCTSELAEAMEGHRKGLQDSHLPHRSSLEVELADTIIRILDMAGGMDLDIGGAMFEKLEYNRIRADHSHEARLQEGGKKY